MQFGNENRWLRNYSFIGEVAGVSFFCYFERYQTRKVGFFLILAALFFTLAKTALCANALSLPDGEQLFNKAREGGEYTSLSEEELTAAEQLFSRMLQGERGQDLFSAWEKLGFLLRKARFGGKEVFALAEKAEQKQGRGFYLFPLVATGSTVLMMPHGFYDLHTRVIGQYLFTEGTFLAAAWNTVHRNKFPGRNHGAIRDGNPWQWDMADLPNTYFTALTRAFARVQPQGHLVQLHGFAKEKRKSLTARDSDLVLGNGTEFPPDTLQALGDCLKINLPFMVRLYPQETRDLGATENISARILDALGHNGFVQMEMSLALREQLRSSVPLRQVVLNCIQTAWH